jgi:predicted RNase H-like HicB family nuclease
MSQNLQYMVVIERGATSYGAYVPDLPGCVAVGEEKEEALELIKEAIELHLEALRQQGLPIPEPCSSGELIEVPAA